MEIILRHKETNVIYRHVEDNIFQNVVNEKTKALSKEECKMFTINATMTNFANKNENFLKLIKAGMLSFEL